MEETLAERGSRYGSWRTQAEIAQAVKEAYRSSPNWDKLPPYMRETLDINANKVARCLNGDFMYLDNWHDMTNYLKLAEDCLEQDIAAGAEGFKTVDPDNPTLYWLIEQLTKKGYDVVHREALAAEEPEVAAPAFMQEPVRAAGMKFTSPPPTRRAVPRVELADYVLGRLDRREPVYLYIPPNRVLCKAKTELIEWYATEPDALRTDLQDGMVDGYQALQDLSGLEPDPPIYIGCLYRWERATERTRTSHEQP